MVVLLMPCLQGCFDDDSNAPYYYPLSKWQSTDGSIIFYMGDDRIGYGTIITKEETVDVYFTFNFERQIFCNKISDYWVPHSVETLELWSTKCRDKSFTATVSETTYFEPGQIIVFELVEENIDESEVPYPPNPDNIERYWY